MTIALDRTGVQVMSGDMVEQVLPGSKKDPARIRHVGKVVAVEGDVIQVQHRCCEIIDFYVANKWIVLR